MSLKTATWQKTKNYKYLGINKSFKIQIQKGVHFISAPLFVDYMIIACHLIAPIMQYCGILSESLMMCQSQFRVIVDDIRRLISLTYCCVGGCGEVRRVWRVLWLSGGI